jgi:muramoyltetrapeptide carboxypeptidase
MSRKKIQPPFLKKGDEVAIISPSYCIEENLLYAAVEYLNEWGLKVRLGKNAAKKNGPFAGTDKERLDDLREVTTDPDVKAVFCSRGGYGLLKIIDRVDFSGLKENPKWYSGFSDITVLHTWLNEVCGIMSVHGEMPVNFNNNEKSANTFISLKKALFGETVIHEWNGIFLNPADVKGEMTGGNLSLLYSLSGTKAEISTKGKVLFIEDVGEHYYHLDRMLTSLKLSGKLEDLAAMVIGGMNKIEDSKVPWGKNTEETISGIVSEFNYPVLFNFPAGHISDNRAIYIGKKATIKVTGNNAVLRYD